MVSSDLWLRVLSLSEKYRSAMAGVMRHVVAVVPLHTDKTPSDEMVVPIESPQPGLPDGGYCTFHNVFTRDARRIARIEGSLDDQYLNAISVGLSRFLGTGVR